MNHFPTAFVSSRVVLSGASGMIGAALCNGLDTAGYSILRLVRRRPASAKELQWDPSAVPALPDAGPLEGATAVIHLSGANIAEGRWTAKRRRELWESRIVSTRALAETLAGLERRPEALLVASATGFYGNRGEQLLDENSLSGQGFLAGMCREWEAAAEPARRAGIRLVHLRTGIVLAPGQGALARMTPLFRLGLGGPLGTGSQWQSWISLPDLVAAILFVLENPTISGPVNLTAPNPVTNMQFTRALARQLKRPAWLPAPAFALRLAFGQMADEALLASARVYPSRLTGAFQALLG